MNRSTEPSRHFSKDASEEQPNGTDANDASSTSAQTPASINPSTYPTLTQEHLGDTPVVRRRRVLPIVLFVVTCASTFLAGATDWSPPPYLMDPMELRRIIICNWQQGLIYMGAVLAILLCHEMGHFLATVRYRIPASYPFFLPLPISPIGTMGAVIGMAGHRADRRQTFDIGIAGPLAGLVVVLPILWIGIQQLDITGAQIGAFELDCPWLVRLMLPLVRPDLKSLDTLWISQVNPYFMAAWVGLLITGLNMMPVSQLDGGHVVYTLLLQKGHWVARGFLFFAIAYVVLGDVPMWGLMVIIVILIGSDHPPTSNDNMPLGWFRTTLGYASLAIPIVCFPPHGIITH